MEDILRKEALNLYLELESVFSNNINTIKDTDTVQRIFRYKGQQEVLDYLYSKYKLNELISSEPTRVVLDDSKPTFWSFLRKE